MKIPMLFLLLLALYLNTALSREIDSTYLEFHLETSVPFTIWNHSGLQSFRKIEYKNISNEGLEIKNVKASCNCVSIQINKKYLARGETGEATVFGGDGVSSVGANVVAFAFELKNKKVPDIFNLRIERKSAPYVSPSVSMMDESGSKWVKALIAYPDDESNWEIKKITFDDTLSIKLENRFGKEQDLFIYENHKFHSKKQLDVRILMVEKKLGLKFWIDHKLIINNNSYINVDPDRIELFSIDNHIPSSDLIVSDDSLCSSGVIVDKTPHLDCNVEKLNAGTWIIHLKPLDSPMVSLLKIKVKRLSGDILFEVPVICKVL